MHIHLLDVTVYPANGGTWKTQRTPNPTLEDIETEVRRLDRLHYPYLQDANASEDAQPEFTMMGSVGEYTSSPGLMATSYSTTIWREMTRR